MKTVIVSKQNKAKHNPSHFKPFFSFSSQNSKTQQPSVAKEGYITTAEEEPQNTQQRNHKSAHFYFACIVTTLGLNEETYTVK